MSAIFFKNQPSFKETAGSKNDQIFKQLFFASNELSTCSRCCRKILQQCDVCKWGLGGFERHYNQSIFKKCLHKNRSPE